MKFRDAIIGNKPITVIYRYSYALRPGLRVLFRYCGSKKFLQGIVTKIENQTAFIQLA